MGEKFYILTFFALNFIIFEQKEITMKDIDLSQLDNQSLIDLKAILEGMDEVLKTEVGVKDE